MNTKVKKISNTSLAAAKIITRRDAYAIDIKLLEHAPDFNPPGRTITDFEADLPEEDQQFYNYIISGGDIGTVLFWVENDRYFLNDGNRRVSLIKRAIAKGDYHIPDDGIIKISAKLTELNDVDRLATICTSNSSKKLGPIDLAYVYGQMRKKQCTLADIAKKVFKSVAHVQQMLSLLTANQDVQNAVKSGEIAASAAVAMVRESGGGGASGLLKTAREKGGKITATSAVVKITDKQRIETLQKLIDDATIPDFVGGVSLRDFIDSNIKG